MERLRIVNKVTLGKDNNIRDDTKPILHLHLCTVMFSSLYTLETSAFEVLQDEWAVLKRFKARRARVGGRQDEERTSSVLWGFPGRQGDDLTEKRGWDAHTNPAAEHSCWVLRARDLCGKVRSDTGRRFQGGDQRVKKQFKASLWRNQQGRKVLCSLVIGNHWMFWTIAYISRRRSLDSSRQPEKRNWRSVERVWWVRINW